MVDAGAFVVGAAFGMVARTADGSIWMLPRRSCHGSQNHGEKIPDSTDQRSVGGDIKGRALSTASSIVFGAL